MQHLVRKVYKGSHKQINYIYQCFNIKRESKFSYQTGQAMLHIERNTFINKNSLFQSFAH